MENHYPTRPKVAHETSQHRSGVALELQHVSAKDCVELAIEINVRRIAIDESDVSQVLLFGALASGLQSRRRSICTNDLAFLPYHGRNQKRYVTDAAADVKDAHPRLDAGGVEEAAGNWIN
jgi:hypothetical protein